LTKMACSHCKVHSYVLCFTAYCIDNSANSIKTSSRKRECPLEMAELHSAPSRVNFLNYSWSGRMHFASLNRPPNSFLRKYVQHKVWRKSNIVSWLGIVTN
jgi:hypothetical protein